MTPAEVPINRFEQAPVFSCAFAPLEITLSAPPWKAIDKGVMVLVAVLVEVIVGVLVNVFAAVLAAVAVTVAVGVNTVVFKLVAVFAGICGKFRALQPEK